MMYVQQCQLNVWCACEYVRLKKDELDPGTDYQPKNLVPPVPPRELSENKLKNHRYSCKNANVNQPANLVLNVCSLLETPDDHCLCFPCPKNVSAFLDETLRSPMRELQA